MEEARETFAQESAELIEEMENSLLRLEAAPSDSEALNTVFRAVHTLKGSAGIVGIENVENFAHKVESLLEQARQKVLAINSEIIDLLLECRDLLSALVAQGLSSTAPDQATIDSEHALSIRLASFLGTSAKSAEAVPAAVPDQGRSGNWHISLRFGANVFKDGMDPVSFINYLENLGRIAYLSTITDAIPYADNMDPEACYLGFEIDLEADTTETEIREVFEFVADDCTVHIVPPGSEASSFVKLIEDLPEDNMRIGEILVHGGVLTKEQLEAALDRQEREEAPLGDILVNEGLVHPSVVDAAVQKQKSVSSSIRVDTEKLDVLINLVGELVISSANIDQQARRIRDRELTQSYAIMERLIEEIRDSAMRVRMMPLWDTFNRFNRIVRDICHETEKDIELVITGGETELDRTVIERIRDPLMHLVRNAADHGIESPEARKAAGKPPRGRLHLNAYQDTGDIIIEVMDDGKGIDTEAVVQKAISKGVISSVDDLAGRNPTSLIFEPGISTAQKVTNISGRGVGMDVVKRNIEALRGSVDIESRKGTGTKIIVRLPLTLAIIEGFLVSIDKAFYVVPMDMVVECVEINEKDRKAAHGRHHLNLRGSVLPYIRLRDMFGFRGAPPALEHVLIVKHSGRSVGLLVDKLHGGVQTVIKNLGRVYRNIPGVSGATIMGDGTVSLILNVQELIHEAIARASEASSH